MLDTISSSLPVAIIGAGPIGLAAAAQLVSRGLAIQLFEAGAGIASNLESYHHVKLFSPWQYNLDKTAVELLEREKAWVMPDSNALPTAAQLIDQYLLPLSSLQSIAPYLHLNARVLAVSRQGFDKVKTKGRENSPFILRVQMATGIQEFLASAVIDASGTWSQPNPMGAHGLPAQGEIENAEFISYGMPDVAGLDRAKYEGKKVLVVGAGHSAVGTLLALASLVEQDPKTRIVWAVRGNDISKAFGGGVADGLPARGALGLRLRQLIDDGRLEVHTGFKINAVTSVHGRLTVNALDPASPVITDVEAIVVATGARPDHRLSRELRTQHDPWLESTTQLAPLIDPNEHSCGTVRPHGHRELAHPEPNFYSIGAKSYGRAPNFLMATGYEQARSVVAAIAGDMVAADSVQLELPQTGVCSTRPSGVGIAKGGACCLPNETSTLQTTTACCSPKQVPQTELSNQGCCVSMQSAMPTLSSSACCG